MKTIKQQLKRAFTIVELVIVIAVIAALAAVLIPTFVNVLNSASESNDTVLAKNLDTSLITVQNKLTKTDVTDGDGNYIYNVTEAITLVRNDGYDVSKLTPTADNADYVYNASTNRFLYYTDNFTALTYGEEPATTDTLVVIDTDLERVGLAETAGLSNVNYCVYTTYDEDADIDEANITVWLYTEGGSVNINSAGGTVYHYGEATSVVIEEVATESYHLYGEVEEITLEKGHVELTSSAVCTTITSNSSTDTVITVVGTKSELNLVGTFATYYTKTSDTATSTKVEEEAFAETSGVILEGTAASNPYKLSTADDVANIDSNSSSTATTYFQLVKDITLTSALSVSYNVVLDLNSLKLEISGSATAFSSNTACLINNGTLTIIDSTATDGELELSCTTTTFGVYNTGHLILGSGKVNASYSAATGILNQATDAVVTINGGELYAEKRGINNNTGTLEVNGGTISCSSKYSNKKTSIYSAIFNSSNGNIVINGGTIKGYYALNLSGGAVTIGSLDAENTDIIISGIFTDDETMDMGDRDRAIYVDNGSTLNIYSGTISGTTGIVCASKTANTYSTLNIYGGDISGTNAAISGGADSETVGYVKLNIYGGTITSDEDLAIYAPQQKGITYIYGGKITGVTGVEIRNGEAYIGEEEGKTIDALVIKATGTPSSTEANHNGSTTVGMAIAISTYNEQDITVTIGKGVYYSAAYSLYEENVNNEELNVNISVTVTDGTFTGIVYSQNLYLSISGGKFTNNTNLSGYCAEGYTVSEKGEDNYYSIIVDESAESED